MLTIDEVEYDCETIAELPAAAKKKMRENERQLEECLAKERELRKEQRLVLRRFPELVPEKRSVAKKAPNTEDVPT